MPTLATADQVRDLVRSFRVGVLTTVDEHYRLVSRPMLTLGDEFTDMLWFAAPARSRVVAHVRSVAAVNIAFVTGKAWVSLAGAAAVRTDPDLVARLWTTDLALWLPEDAYLHEQIAILEVTVTEARFWRAPGAVEQLVHLARSRTSAAPRTAGTEW
ncbi:pyridoxamine 5'-phosphate oxidase family protein [Rhodococcus zopfii]|uniref:pyridoxamine 5'-phosphate oxidase family protein n=1 Tax=Rhodococcus zopfii TaxID=43772 RepID=UPI000933C066|nr:pyridoxamine 5'-phosphate oxidase family protein [Rhodococcus zopfii]